MKVEQIASAFPLPLISKKNDVFCLIIKLHVVNVASNFDVTSKKKQMEERDESLFV